MKSEAPAKQAEKSRGPGTRPRQRQEEKSAKEGDRRAIPREGAGDRGERLQGRGDDALMLTGDGRLRGRANGADAGW